MYLYFICNDCLCFISWQCLHGKPMKGALRYICRPTPQSWSCSIDPSRSRKRISKRCRERASWKRWEPDIMSSWKPWAANWQSNSNIFGPPDVCSRDAFGSNIKRRSPMFWKHPRPNTEPVPKFMIICLKSKNVPRVVLVLYIAQVAREPHRQRRHNATF